MMKSTLAGAVAAVAVLTLSPFAGVAQNETVPADAATTTAPAPPPAATAPDFAPPPPPPAADPAIPPVTGTETIVTTTTEPTPDIVLPPLEPVNPYANSYNEMEPLMVEEDRGFDDWGLLGLLGLLGLIGLTGRRERIIYVERDETRVYRAPGDDLPPR
jgi:hypothetical protein